MTELTISDQPEEQQKPGIFDNIVIDERMMNSPYGRVLVRLKGYHLSERERETFLRAGQKCALYAFGGLFAGVWMGGAVGRWRRWNRLPKFGAQVGGGVFGFYVGAFTGTTAAAREIFSMTDSELVRRIQEGLREEEEMGQWGERAPPGPRLPPPLTERKPSDRLSSTGGLSSMSGEKPWWNQQQPTEGDWAETFVREVADIGGWMLTVEFLADASTSDTFEFPRTREEQETRRVKTNKYGDPIE
ncbi:hypothetical protein HK104_009511 [Borealophlyctis nickersoniae]|nr:hypothetical protein HK104_009511 [Borealophlyctis nickersoniae]